MSAAREEVEAELQAFVEEGVLVRFVSRTGAPMWGFTPGPHAHIWGGPKIEDWQRTDSGAIEVDIRWRCSHPGCGQYHTTMSSFATADFPRGTDESTPNVAQ